MFDKAFNLFKKLEEKDTKVGKGPRVQADSQIDLTNYMELQFTGPVIIGSNQESIKVIYDTGSDWLAVDTDSCSTCN